VYRIETSAGQLIGQTKDKIMKNTTPKKALALLDKTAANYASVFNNESVTQFKVKLARVALAKTPAQSAEALDALLAEIANQLTAETVIEETVTAPKSTYELNAGDAMSWHDKVFTDTSVDRCSVCGRKVSGNELFVEVHDGGNLVEFGKGDVHSAGYMGCWAVGTECAKKFSPELLGKIN